jgi:hypothetical protein
MDLDISGAIMGPGPHFRQWARLGSLAKQPAAKDAHALR